MRFYKYKNTLLRYPKVGSEPIEITKKLTGIEVKRMLGISKFNPIPFKLIDGYDPPRVEGESWFYSTKTGIPIRHPSAYRKCGWSNMVYSHSTKVIVIGKELIKL